MVHWDQAFTIAIGIFIGLGAFAALLALIFTFFDRQEKRRQVRKEVLDLNIRIHTLETENLRLRQQLPQDEDEDEALREALEGMMQGPPPVQEAVREDVRVAKEPRPTRYDRIEDNEPPV